MTESVFVLAEKNTRIIILFIIIAPFPGSFNRKKTLHYAKEKQEMYISIIKQ